MHDYKNSTAWKEQKKSGVKSDIIATIIAYIVFISGMIVLTFLAGVTLGWAWRIFHGGLVFAGAL